MFQCVIYQTRMTYQCCTCTKLVAITLHNYFRCTHIIFSALPIAIIQDTTYFSPLQYFILIYQNIYVSFNRISFANCHLSLCIKFLRSRNVHHARLNHEQFCSYEIPLCSENSQTNGTNEQFTILVSYYFPVQQQFTKFLLVNRVIQR